MKTIRSCSFFRAALLIAATAILCSPITTFAQTLPSGQVQFQQSLLEPAYNDSNGQLMFLLTPMHTPSTDQANVHAVAPLYLVVYPNSVASVIGTVNCQHQPMDNCPTHGPEIAGLAEATEPAAYQSGVWGHDHIAAGTPVGPPSDADFNVAWMPVAVLFTQEKYASNHITTITQLNAAYAAGQVIEIPLAGATFQCSAVSEAVYDQGTPLPPAPPLP